MFHARDVVLIGSIKERRISTVTPGLWLWTRVAFEKDPIFEFEVSLMGGYEVVVRRHTLADAEFVRTALLRDGKFVWANHP